MTFRVCRTGFVYFGTYVLIYVHISTLWPIIETICIKHSFLHLYLLKSKKTVRDLYTDSVSASSQQLVDEFLVHFFRFLQVPNFEGSYIS